VRANDAVFTSFAVESLRRPLGSAGGSELTLSDPETGERIPMEAISARCPAEGRGDGVVTILHDQSEAMEKASLYEQVKRHSEELEERVKEATAELAEQNELLRRQALELEQASAMKSQFLANVSHELRTPLNAIVGYTALLLEGVSGTARRRPAGEAPAGGLQRPAPARDHQRPARPDRIESGKMPVRSSGSRCRGFDEVMAEAEPLIQASDLEVGWRSPGLPELASDRQKVKQILLNLLSNALKFTPDGEVRIEADYDRRGRAGRRRGHRQRIGISEENQKTIFEAFGQSDSSTPQARAAPGWAFRSAAAWRRSWAATSP
jgi:signal transduction histidine kinase